MRFLEPALFYVWGGLIFVPLILYLFRPRPRTVRTSTLPFFKWLAREHQDNAWLRRLKQLLSLLITLTVILFGASSLGRLVVSPSEDALATVVMLIDRSASMDARIDDGPTRMDEALSLLRTRLAGMPAGVGVSVIAYDRQPEVLLARTIDRREVERTLNAVSVRPIAGESAAALKLARRLAALETPAAVWHVTDFEPDLIREETDTTDGTDDLSVAAEVQDDVASNEVLNAVDIRTFKVGLPRAINAGITAFQLRRVPLQQARPGYEAFVQIRSSSDSELPAELEVHQDGALVQLRKLTLEPGGVETLLIPIDANVASEESNTDETEDAAASNSDSEQNGERQNGKALRADRILTLKLNVEGDVLSSDDVLHARIPDVPPVRVLWLSDEPDPFVELAFSTISTSNDIQMLQGRPSVWPPKDPVDVVIFDRWTPEEWPADVAVIAIEPSKAIGPVRAVPIPGDGLPIENLRVTESDHPLLYGVASERIGVRQRVVLDATGPLQPLWTGPSGPVLVAGESRGQRVIVMGFSPQQSDRFPLTTSFPIYLANCVYWAAGNRLSETLGFSRRTGEIVELQGDELKWFEPGPAADAEPKSSARIKGHWNELDRIGLWETDSGQRGSAALLSTVETELPLTEANDVAASDSQAASPAESSFLQGNLVPLLMWSVFVLLLTESWLYHRHAV